MAKFFSDAFSNASGQCEYCGKNLLEDFDVFWMTAEDHLTPKSVGVTDEGENIVIACNVCNNLKGKYNPEGDNREEKIANARKYIFERRAEKIPDFLSWKVKLQ